MHRHVRTIISALCIVVCGSLIILWFRSYKSADELNGWLGPQRITVGSREGRMVFAAVVPNGYAEDSWYWRIRSTDTLTKYAGFLPDDAPSSEADSLFAPGDLQRQATGFGIGIIDRPCYFSLIEVKSPSGVTTAWRFAVNRSMYCKGLILPFWLLVLFSGFVFALVRMGKSCRFSIRGMLVAMTFACALLGLVVMVDRTTEPDGVEPGIPPATIPGLSG